MVIPQLILASASPARTKLLGNAHVAHRVLVSSVDEDAVTASAGPLSPAETAQLLADAKAKAVASLPEASDALVIGCDSVFEFDGEAFGKPHQPEVAAQRWAQMRGKSGVLHTGHCLIDNRPDSQTSGLAVSTTASAVVHFGDLSEAEISAYVATGEPLEVAGAFTIDGIGSAFIESVDGDPHTVIGLSIATLRGMLAQCGVSISELWD